MANSGFIPQEGDFTDQRGEAPTVLSVCRDILP